jgi:hypothetical protein
VVHVAQIDQRDDAGNLEVFGVLEEFLHEHGQTGYEKAQADEFMYMGSVACAVPGGYIHLFKHRETRRYLNLTEAGIAFAYRPRPGMFDYAWTEPRAALEHALS